MIELFFSCAIATLVQQSGLCMPWLTTCLRCTGSIVGESTRVGSTPCSINISLIIFTVGKSVILAGAVVRIHLFSWLLFLIKWRRQSLVSWSSCGAFYDSFHSTFVTNVFCSDAPEYEYPYFLCRKLNFFCHYSILGQGVRKILFPLSRSSVVFSVKLQLLSEVITLKVWSTRESL
jgi:hypothetical protein